MDGMQHVNDFESFANYEHSLEGINFDIQCLKQETVVLRYSTVRELTHELKGLGAHNITAHRPTKLTGKAKLRQFISAYESKRVAEGYLPASYQVLWGVLVKK